MTFMATQTPNEIWVQVGDERRLLEGAELEAFLAHKEEIAAQEQAKKDAEEKAATKRQALLDKLGITEDEAKLLLGGN